MPATELNRVAASQLIDFLDSIEDFSYQESDLAQFEWLENWDKMQENSPNKYFKYYEYPDIFNLTGSLRKKYRYSLLKGYDIIDVSNCIRLKIANNYWYAKESPFRETMLNLVNEDLISKVLRTFIPDSIEDFIELIRDGIDADCESGLYRFLNFARERFYVDYEYDGYFDRQWNETVFNKIPIEEKKAIIYSTCYWSDKFREWSELYYEFSWNGFEEDLEDFKKFILSIGSLPTYKYWEAVYDRLNLKEKLFP